MTMTGKIFPTGLLAMLFLFAGCRNYQPVHSGEPVRISLAPIVSQTGVAQVVAPLSRNLHEKLNHAPNWKLVGDGSAEVVLVINVLGLNREAIARDPADTGRPLSYYESLRVSIEWVSDLPPPWGTEPISTVEASTLVYAQPSLTGAESIAVTEMAEELARKIVERLNWPGPPSRP
jgi:hypothetical protein